MKKYLMAMTILFSTSLAHGQTPLYTQQKDTSTFCDTNPDPQSNPTLAHCATDATMKGNYPSAFKWTFLGANRGDYAAQEKLGSLYEKGKGVAQDYVQAYKWYDIAAATHAACIAELPPSLHSAETNGSEISDRDSVAKKMSSEQIEEAQRLERGWKPKERGWTWHPYINGIYVQQYLRATSVCSESSDTMRAGDSERGDGSD